MKLTHILPITAQLAHIGLARDPRAAKRQYASSTLSQTPLQQITSAIHQSENTTTIVSEIDLTTTVCTSDTDVGAASGTATATTPQQAHTASSNYTEPNDKPKGCSTVTLTTTETMTITETEHTCRLTRVTDASAASPTYATHQTVQTSPAWTYINSTGTSRQRTSTTSTSTSTQTTTLTVITMQSNPTASTSGAVNAGPSSSSPGVPQGPSPYGYNETMTTSTAGSMTRPLATDGTNSQSPAPSSQSQTFPTPLTPSISYGHPPIVSTSEGHTSTGVSTSPTRPATTNSQRPTPYGQSLTLPTTKGSSISYGHPANGPSISYGHPPIVSTPEHQASTGVSTSAIEHATINSTSTEASTTDEYYTYPSQVGSPPYTETCGPCSVVGIEPGFDQSDSEALTTPATPSTSARPSAPSNSGTPLQNSAICTTTFQNPTENPCTATVFADTTTIPVDCSGCEEEQPSTFPQYAFIGPSTPCPSSSTVTSMGTSTKTVCQYSAKTSTVGATKAAR